MGILQNYLLWSFVWALSCLAFDVINTNRGLRAGVAVEGSSLITALFGPKPSLIELLIIETNLRLALLSAAVFLPTPAGLPSVWHACVSGAFVSYGLKNIQGGRQWRWLMANPGKTLPQSNTVGQKLLGFWG